MEEFPYILTYDFCDAEQYTMYLDLGILWDHNLTKIKD